MSSPGEAGRRGERGREAAGGRTAESRGDEPEGRAGRFADRNLLVVAHSYTTFVKEQVDLLAEQFRNVAVFVRYNPVAEVADYLPIRWLDPYRKSAKIDDDAPDNVEVYTTSLLYVPTDGGYRRLGDRHARKLREQVREHPLDFDLVHAHFTWTAGYAARAIARELDVPYLVTVHANRDRFREEHENGPEGVYETWRDAAAVIRVNRRDLPALRKYADRAYFLPNGYSRDRIRLMNTYVARERVGVPPETDLLFALGTLRRRKGYRYLVDAVADLRERRRSDTVAATDGTGTQFTAAQGTGNGDGDLLCVIAGHGGRKRAIARRIERHGLSETVRLLGYVSDEELSTWLNACDAFAHPSTSEGNPTVLFEALGCGKPYVGSDVGGVSEIVTDDRYGLLCPPGDPEALADVLETALVRTWDRQAILDYAEQFTWQAIVRELLTLYESVLTGEACDEPPASLDRLSPG
jgi:glycosyltransferase involved in cell wall biosynthesis